MSKFFINYLSLLLILVFSISSPFVFIKVVLPKVRKVLNKKNKKIFSNLISVKFFYSVSFILPPLIVFFSLKNTDINQYENINQFLTILKRIAGFIVIIYLPVLLNKFLSAISLSFKSNHFFIRYPINSLTATSQP